MQWRLAFTSAVILTISCVVLTVSFNRSARLQFQNLEVQVIRLQPNTEQLRKEQSDFPENNLPQQFRISRSAVQLESIGMMAFVILLSAASAYWMTGKALSPLRELSDKMESVQIKNLSEPIEVPKTEDEISRLSNSFNKMLMRLEQSFTAQKRFSSNAAHELRTPLAVIQAKLEVLTQENNWSEEEKKDLEIVYMQTERLSHLVEELLQMARLETFRREDSVNLPDLIDEVICDLADVAQEKQISLTQRPGSGELLGNDTLLYRAIYNLTENAIKYQPLGGKVELCSKEKDRFLEITIQDDGYGIPEKYRTEVFEPFFRLNKPCSQQAEGCGLGIALVKAIVELHRGEIKIDENLQGGTSVTVRIPKDTFDQTENE